MTGHYVTTGASQFPLVNDSGHAKRTDCALAVRAAHCVVRHGIPQQAVELQTYSFLRCYGAPARFCVLRCRTRHSAARTGSHAVPWDPFAPASRTLSITQYRGQLLRPCPNWQAAECRPPQVAAHPPASSLSGCCLMGHTYSLYRSRLGNFSRHRHGPPHQQQVMLHGLPKRAHEVMQPLPPRKRCTSWPGPSCWAATSTWQSSCPALQT